MHCIPHPRMHGLNGYMEVIETLAWGLQFLGHNVTYALNHGEPEATNIVFGAHVLPIEFLEQLPAASIIYNFEQMRGLQPNQIRTEVRFIAGKFRIWDYSISNFDAWKGLGVNAPTLVPVGYAPVLTRIQKCKMQDIDILIYGLPGDKRLQAFDSLSQAGLVVMFVCGLYGQARDDLIARSKIVLNINLYDYAQIFEIVRVSFLFANKKAVVATRDTNTYVEPDIGASVKLTTPDQLVDDCERLLADDKERRKLELTGFENFVKRDISKILEKALSV